MLKKSLIAVVILAGLSALTRVFIAHRSNES